MLRPVLVAGTAAASSSAPAATASAAGALLLLLLAATLSLAGAEDGDESTSCQQARLKCLYRADCGSALQNYMVDCSSVMHAEPPVRRCPEVCQLALIALTSNDEGKQLMTCHCRDDDYCATSKARLEVCRPDVERAHRNETVVSCLVAQSICAADSLCQTALEYYHRFCRSMFDGRKCTYRCKNSISILRRQQKAAKLDTCWCDGREDYDCPRIRTNMERLCFRRSHQHNHSAPAAADRPPPHAAPGNDEDNELAAAREGASHASRAPPPPALAPHALLLLLLPLAAAQLLHYGRRLAT